MHFIIMHFLKFHINDGIDDWKQVNIKELLLSPFPKSKNDKIPADFTHWQLFS